MLIDFSPPMGPFTAGFIIQHLGWRWMYYIMAIVCPLLPASVLVI